MNDDVKEKERVVSDPSLGAGGPPTKQTILVQVVATRDWDDGVGFQLKWEHPKGVWHSGPMVFPKDDIDRELAYDLVDETGLDLVFDSKADDCIWVTTAPCPKHTLENKNNTYPYTLHYALRFTGKTYEVEGKQFGPNYAYDPEYRNNGGGGNV
jgi:hypothetical protein